MTRTVLTSSSLAAIYLAYASTLIWACRDSMEPGGNPPGAIEHLVQLDGLASNCRVTSESSRWIDGDDHRTALLSFSVSCSNQNATTTRDN